jgi:response regulator RpfG family c-di-GMP phosphodiesterase
LAKLLDTSFEMGTAANSKELLEVAATLKPDLVILDRGMQDAGDQLKELLPNTKQIVLTIADGVRSSSCGSTGVRFWISSEKPRREETDPRDQESTEGDIQYHFGSAADGI